MGISEPAIFNCFIKLSSPRLRYLIGNNIYVVSICVMCNDTLRVAVPGKLPKGNTETGMLNITDEDKDLLTEVGSKLREESQQTGRST